MEQGGPKWLGAHGRDPVLTGTWLQELLLPETVYGRGQRPGDALSIRLRETALGEDLADLDPSCNNTKVAGKSLCRCRLPRDGQTNPR